MIHEFLGITTCNVKNKCCLRFYIPACVIFEASPSCKMWMFSRCLFFFLL
uniref:Uncharacterized protein n=1 Tax=Arundo donax TaxID=35708 RepID=A0A0A8XUJ4_ARUDO